LRICFIADDRSPIALGWIRYVADRGHEVYVISTRARTLPSSPDALRVPPGRGRPSTHDEPPRAAPRAAAARIAHALGSELRGGALSGVATIGAGITEIASTLAGVAGVRRLIAAIDPDVVHAMRIPFEGILAGLAVRRTVPLVLSVWGNDFTLHARRNPVVAALTRRALARADALHCDCSRDMRLAFDFGFDVRRPSVVLPGGGGVSDVFLRAGAARPAAVSSAAPVIVNARGLRPYVCNAAFFEAVPAVLRELPSARFVCTGMHGEPVAERWVRKLGIQDAVDLRPVLPMTELAACFARADVTVSPSTHDGTPNTLLEAMAAGVFPVAGALDSVQEWITHDRNGLLCDPVNPESIASAIIRAVEDTELRTRARTVNARLINERARHGSVMAKAIDFYERILRRDSCRAEPARRRPQVTPV
jgi:glycosyltransferase involved in cell wall biosynthesis